MNFAGPIQQCVVCGSPIPLTYTDDRIGYRYSCDVCGKISISAEAAWDIHATLPKDAYLISGFTRERTERGLPPIDILTSNLGELVKGANIPSDISQKLDRILLYLEKSSAFPGHAVQINRHTLYPIAYAKNQEEFEFLLTQLRVLGYVEFPVKGEILLALAGWNRLVQIHRSPKISTQAFVAMWFTPDTEKAYDEGIARAITECAFTPVRVDKLEHNNKICDVIIAEIRRSAFLVADFTGHRGGVYFEAGYAMGLGIPVIWLCRKDQIDNAHFDTRQYNHITWDTEAELYHRLLQRIRATIF
jgi:hypothetical protein